MAGRGLAVLASSGVGGRKPISETAKTSLHILVLRIASSWIKLLWGFLSQTFFAKTCASFFSSCYVLTFFIVRYDNIRIFTEFWNMLNFKGTCSRTNEVKKILWTGVENFNMCLGSTVLVPLAPPKIHKLTILQNAELLAFRQLLTQETKIFLLVTENRRYTFFFWSKVSLSSLVLSLLNIFFISCSFVQV